MNREREGLLLCLVSAAGFGAMPIFGRQAFAAGVELTPMLSLRFLLAAAMLWALIALRRRPLGSLRGVALGGLLGLCGYSVQAGLYFGSIQRIDVSLASLILYTYPALVTVAAFALGRERATRRKLAALALASSGVALVVGGGTGTIDWVGAAMAFGCAVFYTGFILASDRVAATHLPTRLRGQRRHRLRGRLHRRRAAQRRHPRERGGRHVDRAHRLGVDGHADRAVHGRAGARRGVDRLDRLDRRARHHRRAGVARARRGARPAAARRRRARALGGRAAAVPWQDAAMAYVVAARWLAHEGREERVAELIGELGAASRAEPGCLAWVPHRANDKPRLFWIYEQYDDEAAFEAHMASEHFTRLVKGEAIPELLESREREFFTTL